jgi:hypothetical protein
VAFTFCRPAALLVLSIGLLAFPAPSTAQPSDPFNIAPGPRRVDISGSGGVLLSTDWSNLVLLGSVSPSTGALEQVLSRDLSVDPTRVLDAVVTYWEGRYGFRVHGGFARSCLTLGRTCREARSLAGASGDIDIDMWTFDVGGAIGLLDYDPQRWVSPYVFLGIGAVTYDLEQTVGPPLTFLAQPPPGQGPDVVIGRDDPDLLLISVDELGLETRFAFNVGTGVDFRIPVGGGGIGLRLEVSDHMHRSPVEIQIATVAPDFGPSRTTRVEFGFVHNLRAAAGVVLQFGR